MTDQHKAAIGVALGGLLGVLFGWMGLFIVCIAGLILFLAA